MTTPPDVPDFDDMPDPEAPRKHRSAGMTSAREQGTMTPVDWRPTAAEPIPVVRCTGTLRNGVRKGERCGKWAIRGATVCLNHGGHLPSVREHAQSVVEAARMRIIGLADEAIDALEELVQPGTGEAIRLKAATELLDRAGVKGAIEMKVEMTSFAAPSETINERLAEIAKRLAPKPEKELEVIDIVDNEPEIAEDPTPV